MFCLPDFGGYNCRVSQQGFEELGGKFVNDEVVERITHSIFPWHTSQALLPVYSRSMEWSRDPRSRSRPKPNRFLSEESFSHSWSPMGRPLYINPLERLVLGSLACGIALILVLRMYKVDGDKSTFHERVRSGLLVGSGLWAIGAYTVGRWTLKEILNCGQAFIKNYTSKCKQINKSKPSLYKFPCSQLDWQSKVIIQSLGSK